MKKIKFKIVISDDEGKVRNEKYCRTVQEICDFLEITRSTYINFINKSMKLNMPKTEFLKNVEIIKLTSEEIKDINDINTVEDTIKSNQEKLSKIWNKM